MAAANDNGAHTVYETNVTGGKFGNLIVRGNMTNRVGQGQPVQIDHVPHPGVIVRHTVNGVEAQAGTVEGHMLNIVGGHDPPPPGGNDAHDHEVPN